MKIKQTDHALLAAAVERAEQKTGARVTTDDVHCPSCTAPLKVAQTGVCSSCQTKLSRGDFDWVLSRIEQDEEYQG